MVSTLNDLLLFRSSDIYSNFKISFYQMWRCIYKYWWEGKWIL